MGINSKKRACWSPPYRVVWWLSLVLYYCLFPPNQPPIVFNIYTRKHLRYLISVQKSATRRNLASGRFYRGGTMNKKRPSLAFLDIFWVLIPKIIVILAENQYLGRLAGYQGSMICSYTLFSSHYGLSTKRPRYWFSVKTTMIFGISTQKISIKARDGYQQQKKGMLVPPL